MAKMQGRLSEVHVSWDGGTTYTVIGGITDATLNINQGEIKVTSHDSGSFEEYIPGRKDMTIDCSAVYNEADVPQMAIIQSAFDSTSLHFRFYAKLATGSRMSECEGLITKCNVATPNDDAAKLDFTIRLSGTATWATQP